MQSKGNQILYAEENIQYLLDTIIMEGLFTTGFRTVSNETGIPGTVNEVATIGHATGTVVSGNFGTKKEPGGISPGIILLDRVN
jgi:hypothetical protein